MPANNWQKAEEQIKTQISKLGNTPFYPLSVSVDFSEPLFLQTAVINALRREATLNHCTKRMEAYVRVKPVRKPVHHVFPEKLPPGESNVLNRMAAKFYREHGIENAGSGFELLKPTPKQRVMIAKHCVRYMLGICPKEKHGEEAGDLVLKSDRNSYLLKFECTLCEMHIFTL